MDTNFNSNIDGALKLITINGATYQVGKDASNTEGGISKLFSNFESYKTATDGSYDAKTVYDEIDAIKTAIGAGSENSIADQVSDLQDALGEGFDENSTVADAVAAAKSTVAAASDDYITVSSSADSTDGHMIYTIGTSGIDSAISTAVAGVVNGAPAAFDTLKEISDWITTDTTGAAAILADVANKADKVSSATSGNFAGLDSNGNLTDSGSKASDFATAAQGALAETALQAHQDISGKADKSEMSVVAGTGNDADKTTITLKSGTYATVLTAHQDISGKKDIQTAVTDPTTGNSTSTYEFIATISQNANGEITATKQAVRAASASQSGLMSAAHYSKVEAISASVSGDTLTITTVASA